MLHIFVLKKIMVVEVLEEVVVVVEDTTVRDLALALLVATGAHPPTPLCADPFLGLAPALVTATKTPMNYMHLIPAS